MCFLSYSLLCFSFISRVCLFLLCSFWSFFRYVNPCIFLFPLSSYCYPSSLWPSFPIRGAFAFVTEHSMSSLLCLLCCVAFPLCAYLFVVSLFPRQEHTLFNTELYMSRCFSDPYQNVLQLLCYQSREHGGEQCSFTSLACFECSY